MSVSRQESCRRPCGRVGRRRGLSDRRRGFSGRSCGRVGLSTMAILAVWVVARIIVGGSVVAAELRLNCSGSLKGSPASEVFICTGGASLTDGSSVIQGDNMTFTKEDGVQLVKVSGNVRLVQNGREMRGDSLTYSIKEEVSVITSVMVEETLADAKTPLYLHGEKVTVCGNRSVIDQAKVTTCGPGSPGGGYYLAAKTIEVLAGDRVILRHVRFVEFGIPLFYWPVLVLSLKEDAYGRLSSQQLNLPRIGRSATEGWYIKTTHNYQGPEEQHGKVMLDYMTELGTGVGVEHTFRDDGKTREVYSFYVQPNKKTDVIDYKITGVEEREIGSRIKLKTGATYTSSSLKGLQKDLDGYINITRSVGSSNTNIKYSGIQSSGVVNGYDITGSASHYQSWRGGWRLNLKGDLYRRQRTGYSDRHLFSYLVEGGRDTASYQISLMAEDSFNPELAKDEPPEVNWNRIARVPEINFRWKNLPLIGRYVPTSVEMGYGKYEEYRTLPWGTQRVAIQRWKGAVNLNPHTFKLGRLGEYRWYGSLGYSYYDTGQRVWVPSTRSVYTLPITRTLRFEGNYNYTDRFGDVSPLYFDAVTPAEKLTGRLTYSTPQTYLSLSGGYNLRSNTPDNLVMSARLQPAAGLTLSGQTAYDPAYRRWPYAIGALEYDKEPFVLKVGVRYNPVYRQVDRLDGTFDLQVGQWSFGYTGIYNGYTGKYERGDFALSWDMDCRILSLRYNQPKGEVWLEYRITAFPSARISLGTSEEKPLMFDLPSWKDLGLPDWHEYIDFD